MKRWTATIAILALLMSLATACSQTPPTPGPTTPEAPKFPRADNVLKMSVNMNLTGNFHPDFAPGKGLDQRITQVVFEPLVRLSDTLELILAEDYEVSADQKSVTFFLRKNVKWHDGVPFTADDVKFSFENNAKEGYLGYYAGATREILGYADFRSGETVSLAGVEILDPHTVKITTSDVFGSFFYSLAMSINITPKHVWESVNPAQAHESALLRTPVGTGPFKFVEFVPDQHVILDSFADYWAGKPSIDRVIIRYMNEETAQAGLLSGEIDMMTISALNPDDEETYEASGISPLMLWSNNLQYMVPNAENPLLNNKLVRQALTYAIDRQGMVDTLYSGYARVVNGPYPPHVWFRPDEAMLTQYDYNPQKAIEILTQQVGWEFRNGIMYAEGKPVVFELMTPTGNRPRELSAPVIQQNLKDIGIEINISMMAMAAQVAIFRDRSASFDLGLVANGPPDPDVFRLFGSGVVGNYQRFEDPEIDRLLIAGMRVLDPADRKPYYDEFSKIVNDELPMIPIAAFASFLLVPPGLEGVTGTGSFVWHNVPNWKFTNIVK